MTHPDLKLDTNKLGRRPHIWNPRSRSEY